MNLHCVEGSLGNERNGFAECVFGERLGFWRWISVNLILSLRAYGLRVPASIIV